MKLGLIPQQIRILKTILMLIDWGFNLRKNFQAYQNKIKKMLSLNKQLLPFSIISTLKLSKQIIPINLDMKIKINLQINVHLQIIIMQAMKMIRKEIVK